MKENIFRRLKTIIYILLPLVGGGLVGGACSEEENETTEFDNWQTRNEVFFASLADSLSANPTQWQRILSYSLSPDVVHDADRYIYVKKVEAGTGTDSPAYTDSVRIVYRGRFIPTSNYPDGYVFDETVSGTYSASTANTVKGTVSQWVEGFSTALQYMHRGDHWRVYIPSTLAYGDSDRKSNGVVTVPAYSMLIFDLSLIDFSPAGQYMPVWSARTK
ncbi:MAG: FKBP-type peptidyl-prolyl cis-trans isomerase [Prevotella sp.]|nr:FKBP-type peptidyl-prolyl cis-trans isomerase [Prevotella sp.]